jgi:hypothetical protein
MNRRSILTALAGLVAAPTMVALAILVVAPPVTAPAAVEPATAANAAPPLVRVTKLQVNSLIPMVPTDNQPYNMVANATMTLNIAGRNVQQAVAIPLALTGSPNAAGGCDILNLSLGPINLDLLGLIVVLNNCDGGPVTVNLTALPNGGLLGELLCGLAGGLNNGTALTTLLGTLNTQALGTLVSGLTQVLNQVLNTRPARIKYAVVKGLR